MEESCSRSSATANLRGWLGRPTDRPRFVRLAQEVDFLDEEENNLPAGLRKREEVHVPVVIRISLTLGASGHTVQTPPSGRSPTI